jgi:hypothetical protein
MGTTSPEAAASGKKSTPKLSRTTNSLEFSTFLLHPGGTIVYGWEDDPDGTAKAAFMQIHSTGAQTTSISI